MTSLDELRTALESEVLKLLAGHGRMSGGRSRMKWKREGSAVRGREVTIPCHTSEERARLHDAAGEAAVRLRAAVSEVSKVLADGGFTGSGTPITLTDCIEILAIRASVRAQEVGPDTASREIVSGWCETLSRGSDRMRLLVPLEGLVVEPDDQRAHPLGSGLNLVWLSDADLDEIYTSRDFNFAAGRFATRAVEYAYDRAHELRSALAEQASEDGSRVVTDCARDFVTACVLVTDGHVRIHDVIFLEASAPLVGRALLRTTSAPSTRWGSLRLTAVQLDETLRLRKFIEGNVHVSLSLAVDRLREAAGRWDPRDKLIDAVVGLESLLLQGIKDSELRFRFALNYSGLCDASALPEERERRFKAAQQFYDARSAVVHANTSLKYDPALQADAAVLALRESLHWLLKVPELASRTAPRDFLEDYFRKAYWRAR